MIYPDFDAAWYDYDDIFYPDYQAEMMDASSFLVSALGLGFTAGGFTALLNATWAVYFGLSSLFGNHLNTIDQVATNNMLWWAAKGKLTLRQINDAMMDAEYTEISENLSLQWAYQQIMWDQPFFPDKYVTLINRIRT